MVSMGFSAAWGRTLLQIQDEGHTSELQLSQDPFLAGVAPNTETDDAGADLWWPHSGL